MSPASSLMGLPVELRARIFEWLFSGYKLRVFPAQLSRPEFFQSPFNAFQNGPRKFNLAILRSCRPIHHEAKVVLTSTLCLELIQGGLLNESPPAILRHFPLYLRHLSIDFRHLHTIDLTNLGGLRKLTIREVTEHITKCEKDDPDYELQRFKMFLLGSDDDKLKHQVKQKMAEPIIKAFGNLNNEQKGTKASLSRCGVQVVYYLELFRVCHRRCDGIYLELTFDLDTMQTQKRIAEGSTYFGNVYTVRWEEEKVTVAEKFRSRVLVEKPWSDLSAALWNDPDMDVVG